jgi:alpha-D-xyloside xylohydrolase
MESIMHAQGNRFVREYDCEKLWIEPWGKNSLRVRCTRQALMPEDRDWALLPQPGHKAEIRIEGGGASITNGGLTCRINRYGFLSFENSGGRTLLRERWQDRQDANNRISLLVPGRELKPIPGGTYRATVRFEGNEQERFYGLGQHQEPFLNLKGCEFELAQRNSQVNIPFAVSSLGYGFFWNNPAYGRVSLARNCAQWVAEVTPLIDYWVTAGDTPAQIVEAYTAVTGRAPSFPNSQRDSGSANCATARRRSCSPSRGNTSGAGCLYQSSWPTSFTGPNRANGDSIRGSGPIPRRW